MLALPPRPRSESRVLIGVSSLAASQPLNHSALPTRDARTPRGGGDVVMAAAPFFPFPLAPPLVLVSLREGSRMDDLLDEQPLWAVSVLSESQRHIAGRFAMKGRISDRLLFEDIPYVRGEATGAPLVGGALATLDGRTEQRVRAGDHTLVIGRVLTAEVGSVEGGPLSY